MRRAFIVSALLLACGSAPPPAAAAPPSVETLARRSFERELRALGWNITSDAREITAAHGVDRVVISLAVQTTIAAEGPKVTVMLTLFDGETHSLQGEVSSWAIAPGETAGEAGPRLAPLLGKHAADKLERLHR